MLRINGYLRGAFADGARYVIWDKYTFARTTKLSVSHIERAMTQFRRTATDWRFETIYYRAAAKGEDRAAIRKWRERQAHQSFRRHRRIKIRPASGDPRVTPFEVGRRLIDYITKAARNNGRPVHVDQEFLRRFQITCGLPMEWIVIAWQRCKKIPGYRVRWKGEGGGRKMVIEAKQKTSDLRNAIGVARITRCKSRCSTRTEGPS